MIKVGITGSNGFIGWHLKNNLSLIENFKLIPFERGFFEEKSLDNFTSNCDIIIHLAGINGMIMRTLFIKQILTLLKN